MDDFPSAYYDKWKTTPPDEDEASDEYMGEHHEKEPPPEPDEDDHMGYDTNEEKRIDREEE